MIGEERLGEGGGVVSSHPDCIPSFQYLPDNNQWTVAIKSRKVVVLLKWPFLDYRKVVR